jgi:hypothetical protein
MKGNQATISSFSGTARRRFGYGLGFGEIVA